MTNTSVWLTYNGMQCFMPWVFHSYNKYIKYSGDPQFQAW